MKPNGVRHLILYGVFCVMLLFSFPEAAAQEYPFRHYTNRDLINPLPDLPVYGITQDHSGVMWFGIIGRGIYSYDGSELLKAADDPELTVPVAFIQDEQGYMWGSNISSLIVSKMPVTRNGRPQAQTFEFEREVADTGGAFSLERGESLAYGLDAFARDPDTGGIWAATGSEGLIHFSLSENGVREVSLLTPTDFFTGRDDEINDVYSIVARKNGELVFATRGGWLASVSREQKMRFLADGTLPEFAFRRFDNPETLAVHISLLEDNKGRLLGGTTHGSIWMLETSGIYELMQNPELPFYPDFVEHTRAGMVFQLEEGEDGAIWAGTVHGLGRFFPDDGVPFYFLSGIEDVPVNVLFRDREGHMWAGTNNGIYKVMAGAGAVELLRSKEAAFMNNIQASAISPDPLEENLMWIGGPNMLVEAILKPGRYSFVLHDLSTFSRSGLVNSISPGLQNTLWVDINDGVMVIYPEDLGMQFRPYPGSEPTSTGVFRPGRYYQLYVQQRVQYNFGLLEAEGHQFMASRHINDIEILHDNGIAGTGDISAISRPGIGTIAAGPAAHLWVGTISEGLLRSTVTISDFVKGSADCIRENRCFEPAKLDFDSRTAAQKYFSFHDNRLYISGPEGIHELELNASNSWETRRSWGPDSGVKIPAPAQYSYDVDRNVLWFAGAGGIQAISFESGELSHYISSGDGMLSDHLYGPEAFSLAGGDLYFGTVTGAYRIRPDRLKERNSGPDALISRHSITKNKFGRNEFFVQYSSPYFRDETATEFAYRLLGQETEWVHRGRINNTRYTNLSAVLFPKEFRFEVKAIDGYGLESTEPASLAFVVYPPFFLQWWFVGLLGAGLVFSGSWFFNRRLQKLRQMQIEQALREQFEITQRIGALVAHDMKNTVFSLTFLARNLERKFENEDFRKDAITTLQQSTKHLNELISRLQQNKPLASLTATSTNPHETLKSVASRMRLNLPANTEIRFDQSSRPEWLHDSGAITRIVENLLQNAVDSLPASGGIVELSLSEDSGGYPLITVSDNGCGMSPEFIQDQLFEPFKTTKPQGIGLGMYSVKLLTESHGGKVQVESEPGAGTRFYLRFNPSTLNQA